jgi:hypothetical protein
MLDGKVDEIVMTRGFLAEFFFDSSQVIRNELANFAKAWRWHET